MTILTTLPTEILSMILAHMDKIDLLTCTALNKQVSALVNSILWNTIHLCYQTPGNCFLTCLENLQQNYSWQLIRHVDLQSFLWNDRNLMILMQRAPLLESLVIDNGSRITDVSMEQITRYCPRIQSLRLTLCPIMDVSYHALGQLPKLTNLELLDCPFFHADVFSMHFSDSNLEKFMLAPWENDDNGNDSDDNDIDYDYKEEFIDLTALRRLTHLKLHGFSIDMLHSYIGDHIQANISYLSNLVSIDLEACFFLGDDDAITLVYKLPAGLTRLTLKDAEFSDAVLEKIATCQPKLVELDVSFNCHLTPEGIKSLVCRCPYLTFVNLSYCHMKIQDFKEAGPECTEKIETFENTVTRLGRLDKQAIEAIRRTWTNDS